MIEFFQRLFDSSFMPHGHCFLWKPGLLWLQVGSDVMIAASYFAIPVFIFWFVRKRKYLAFRWMFALFGVFIFLCGVTHLMRIVTVWYGVYWLEGGVKLLTGGVSVATAALLVPLLPEALKLPTPTQLQKANDALEEEIEQRKEAEAKLEEAYEELKETERMKDEFFANVSHELRTPLTLILSPVESVLGQDEASPADSSDDADSPETASSLPATLREKLQTVHNNAIRMLQMVNGLLDFSRLEIGEVDVDRQPTSIDVLTRRISQDFAPLSARNDLDLTYESTLECPLVHIDRYLYERILYNLLSNAVKFTPSGGQIEVGLLQEGDQIELTVSDTGEGIPEEELDSIFEDFRQVDPSSTRRFEGTGLGLSLVKEFTERLDGEVTVDSTLGEGSTFTVTLRAPVAEDNSSTEPLSSTPRLAQQYVTDDTNADGGSIAEAQSASYAPPEPTYTLENGDRPDVVLAEDNPELSSYIKNLLSNTCQVHLAADGEEATRLIWEVDPELVVTDVMMPKKDGLELCRELKDNAATADTPVVMLTALTDRDALLQGWEAGADEYLFKPFHPTELVTRIQTLLHNIQRRKEAERLQAKLEQEILRANERERRRIGQDLHDSLTSHLTGVSMLTHSLLRGRESDTEQQITVKADKVERIVELAEHGAEHARAMARGLNPVKLDDKGLPAALQTLSEDQSLQFDLTCTFEQTGELPSLPEDAAINLYWIAHEAVRNAIKHGDADRVSLRLHAETRQLTLEIVDDGTGFPNPVAELDEGMGMATMRYRADLIGAGLDIENRDEGGVRVTSTLPLGAQG